MPDYTCITYGKVFNDKFNYTLKESVVLARHSLSRLFPEDGGLLANLHPQEKPTHLKRKFPCKPKSNITQNESLKNQKEIKNVKEHKCGYCGKNFSTNSNWNRHIK